MEAGEEVEGDVVQRHLNAGSAARCQRSLAKLDSAEASRLHLGQHGGHDAVVSEAAILVAGRVGELKGLQESKQGGPDVLIVVRPHRVPVVLAQLTTRTGWLPCAANKGRGRGIC